MFKYAAGRGVGAYSIMERRRWRLRQARLAVTPEEPPESLPGWFSYNDAAWASGQLATNITKITTDNQSLGLPSSGNLLDFSDGSDTGVDLAITGGALTSSNTVQGRTPTSGDAFDIFDGKISGIGAVSYVNNIGNSMV